MIENVKNIVDQIKWPNRPLTNADRIRAMTDEELAEWLPFKMGACNMNEKCGNDYTCDACWLDWLKQEVSTNG